MKNRVLFFLVVAGLAIFLSSGSQLQVEFEPVYIENGGLIKTLFTPDVPVLNLRKEPALESEVIKKLTSGDKLELLGEGREEIIDGDNGRWVKVVTGDNIKGWCFNAYLIPTGQAAGENQNENLTIYSDLLGLEFTYPARWGTFYGVLWKGKESSDHGGSLYRYAFFITNEEVSYERFNNASDYLPSKPAVSGTGANRFSLQPLGLSSFAGLKKGWTYFDYFKRCTPRVYDYSLIKAKISTAFFYMMYEDRNPPAPRSSDFSIRKAYFVNLAHNTEVKGLVIELDFISEESRISLNRLNTFDAGEYDRKGNSFNQEKKEGYNNSLEEKLNLLTNREYGPKEELLINEYDTFVSSIKIHY